MFKEKTFKHVSDKDRIAQRTKGTAQSVVNFGFGHDNEGHLLQLALGQKPDFGAAWFTRVICL